MTNNRSNATVIHVPWSVATKMNTLKDTSGNHCTKKKHSKHWISEMVSIKPGTILHDVDSARPIAHEPIVYENNRTPYRLDTPPIQHWLDCARIGYAKTIRHRFDCTRIGYTKTIQHQLDCAPLQLCTSEYKKNYLIKSPFFLISECIYNARKLDVYS